MNHELNKYQAKWLKQVFEPFAEKYADISSPFFLGVSEKYIQAQNRIMIVGQETNGWSTYKTDWSIEDNQKWAIDYLDYQLYYSNDPALKEQFKRRNSSPFWGFFKQFSKDDIVPCWNNVDKAQRNIDGNTKSLTGPMEIELNCIIPDSNETLFQKEIEITQPLLIVFITGPAYSRTMEAALNLKNGSLENAKPSLQNGCVDITEIAGLSVPTFWTYHPAYIHRKSTPLCRDEIIQTIKAGTAQRSYIVKAEKT